MDEYNCYIKIIKSILKYSKNMIYCSNFSKQNVL